MPAPTKTQFWSPGLLLAAVVLLPVILLTHTFAILLADESSAVEESQAI